jgi:hypothetical protein
MISANRSFMRLHFISRTVIWLFALALTAVAPAASARDSGKARPPAASASNVHSKVIMGWLESIFLRPWNIRLTAKLDTGANTSSLHAEKIEEFNRDGKEWVRFVVTDRDKVHEPIQVERPLVRTAMIKERRKSSSERLVVEMTLCKSGKEYQTEFTLEDRSNFNYPVLLGRSFLKEIALVDAGSTFLFKADGDACAANPTKKPGSSPH